MEPLVGKLVKAACATFPDDREVKCTKDSFQWYKIIAASKMLMVPPLGLLKTNMMELNRFVQSVEAFAVCDPCDSIYDWTDESLELQEFYGPTSIISRLNQLRELCQGTVVACDIETRGLDWEDNKLLAFGVAWGLNNCDAFYNLSIRGSTGEQHSEALWKTIQAFFTDPNITFCWHNGKFDCGKLKYLCDIDARVDEDTLLLHYIGVNEKRGSHGLKDLGQLYLQAPAWDEELDSIKKEYCKKHKLKLAEFYYDFIPTKVLIPYMQRDCIATYRLLQLFKRLMRPEAQFMYRQLIRASNIYRDVELAGVQLDLPYLEDLEYELEISIKENERKLQQVASQIWDPILYSKMTNSKITKNSETFNYGSPKQLKWMLQEVLHHPVNSTDALSMQNLLQQCEAGKITNPAAKEFIETIMAVRRDSKHMETYVQGLRNVMCRDYRIRGTFNLQGTETGRLSSTNPNMQNIPRDKKIKNLLVSKPGYVMVQLDYSQAELRVLAYLSGDQSMIRCYQDDLDLHAQVAEDMFGPEFDKEQRNMAKTINFGIAYGRGPSSISENFGKSVAESRQIIDQWFKSKPMVKKYIDDQRRKPLTGEECVTPLGRMRHFVITNEDLYHIQNEYINTPIQATASDMTLLSLMNIHDYLKEKKLDAKICTTVHDSIILEVLDSPELVRVVATECQKIMAETPLQFLPNCTVPFKADVEVGYRWGALTSLEEYLNGSTDL